MSGVATKSSLHWNVVGRFEVARADTFILPSHQEDFGVVVAEALSCGVPVLISNKINIWREIEADDAGVVADDTLDGCNALIEQWQLKANAEKEDMRVKEKECFLNNFEIKKTADSLIAALSN